MKKLLILIVAVAAGLLLVEGIARIVLGGDYYLRKEDIGDLEAHLRENNRKLGAPLLERHPDEELSFVLKPMGRAMYHHPQTGEDQYYTINRHGLRGPNIATVKPAGTKRIALLGDSFVFGVGADDSQTIPVLLEEALDGVEDRFEVINSGIPGYHAGQMKELLIRKTLTFEPDVVVLVVSINDLVGDCLLFDRHLGMLYTDFLPLPYSWKPGFWRNSVAYRYLVEWDKERVEKSRKEGLFAEEDKAFFRENVRAIREEVELREMGFLVVVLPMLENFASYPFAKRHDELHSLLEGMDFADLYPLMKEHDVTKLWFTTYDHHLNAGANRIVSQLILDLMLQRGLVFRGEGIQADK